MTRTHLSAQHKNQIKQSAQDLQQRIAEYLEKFPRERLAEEQKIKEIHLYLTKLKASEELKIDEVLSSFKKNEIKNAYYQYWAKTWAVERKKLRIAYPQLSQKIDFNVASYQVTGAAKKILNTTPNKLIDGRVLYDFKLELKRFWYQQEPLKQGTSVFESMLRSDTSTGLKEYYVMCKAVLEQFVLSLIFDCHCHLEHHLRSIIQMILGEFTDYGIGKLSVFESVDYIYNRAKENSLNGHGFVLNYTVENSKYANLIENQQTFQTCQIPLTPITLVLLNRLIVEFREYDQKAGKYPFACERFGELINNAEDFRLFVLEALTRVNPEHVVTKNFDKKGFKIFKHIDYLLWAGEYSQTDSFLASLQQHRYNTATLSVAYINQLESALYIPFQQLKQRYKEDFENRKEQRNKVSYVSRQHIGEHSEISVPAQVSDVLRIEIKKKNKEKFKKIIEQNLAKLKQDYEYEFTSIGQSPDLASLSVQICLLTWYLKHIGNNLQLSSLNTYKSAIVSDLYCYAVEHSIDLLHADQSDYEDMYEAILSSKRENDEAALRKAEEGVGSTKNVDTYSTAITRLKEFHQCIAEVYELPTLISWFSQYKTNSIQICRSGYLPPRCFGYILHQILPQSKTAIGTKLDDDDLILLQVIYLLAYRCGLRISEILGLKLSDLISPDLRRIQKTSKKTLYKIKNNKLSFLKVQIRNNYDRQLKTWSSQRSLSLHELLNHEEFNLIEKLLKRNVLVQDHEFILLGENRFLFEKVGKGVIQANTVRQILKSCFDFLFGFDQHNLSFHTLRHSAANHMAILLKGSDELCHTWLDYSIDQIRSIRNYVLSQPYTSADRADIWKHLAYFLGHASVEMTANHYLHFGSILYADAKRKECYRIANKVLQQFRHKQNRAGLGRIKTLEIDIGVYNIKKLLHADFLSKIELVHQKQSSLTRRVIGSSDKRFLFMDEGKLPSHKDSFISVLELTVNFRACLSDPDKKQHLYSYIQNAYSRQKFSLQQRNYKEQHSPEELLENVLRYAELDHYKAFHLIKTSYEKAKRKAVFEKNIIELIKLFNQYCRIEYAKIHFYVQDEKSHKAYLRFLVLLKNIVGDEFFAQMNVNNETWKDISKRIASYKSKRIDELVIKNSQPRACHTQIVIAAIFHLICYEIISS